MSEQDTAMNADALYREDVITDRQVGTIRRLTPVDREGRDDPSRAVEYIGSAQVMTPAGALPLSFELQASTLAEAVAAFGPAAEKALEQTMEELREYQRQAASSIVVPGQGQGGGGMGGGMGGMGGGGLKMP